MRKFTKRKIFPTSTDDTWRADLADVGNEGETNVKSVQSIMKSNNG